MFIYICIFIIIIFNLMNDYILHATWKRYHITNLSRLWDSI